MLPRGTSDYALGNLMTCDIQGFMQQLGGLGCIFYNLSLSVYYVAIMKFNMKERDIAKKLEIWIHLIPNVFAIISSIFLYTQRQYAPLPNQHLCWVGTYPQGCLDDPDMECIRGDSNSVYYAEFLLVIPFFVVYVFICILMMMILHHIYTTKKKSDKFRLREENENSLFSRFSKKFFDRIKTATESKDRSNTLRTDMCTSGQATINTNGTSRSGTKKDPLAFDVRKVKKQIRRESKLDHDAPIVLSSIQKSSATQDDNNKQCALRLKRSCIRSKQKARAKLASEQCLLYLSSFLLCFIFTAVARIYGIVGREAPFPLVLLARIFHPSQGVFFILVYCRPHVKSIRSQNPELTWFQAFRIAFKGGGDNDSCSQTTFYEAVMDEEGIDVPRLPEAERQRRQEKIRQQFKRNSVIALGCDPNDEQVKEVEDEFVRIQQVDLLETGLDLCDKPLEIEL